MDGYLCVYLVHLRFVFCFFFAIWIHTNGFLLLCPTFLKLGWWVRERYPSLLRRWSTAEFPNIDDQQSTTQVQRMLSLTLLQFPHRQKDYSSCLVVVCHMGSWALSFHFFSCSNNQLVSTACQVNHIIAVFIWLKQFSIQWRSKILQ